MIACRRKYLLSSRDVIEQLISPVNHSNNGFITEINEYANESASWNQQLSHEVISTHLYFECKTYF